MSADCDALASCPLFQEAFADDANGGYADDATWVLTSSIVILTMQSGFGLLEMGSSTPGNEVNIMLKNVYDVVCGALAYYLLGYGISYGEPSNPFMGLGNFIPDASNPAEHVESGLLYSRYLFQFSFAATSTTIVSGCIAMRMKFFVYCAFSFYAVIVYAFVAHWVWADNGWLNQLGAHDFAGSGPVHLLGATNGLIGILFVGSRTGRFDGSRPKSDFAPASPTSMLFGLFMLWWGWIGFNCGSSFGITDDKWLVATRTAVTTVNSTAGGGLAALVFTQIRTKGKHVRPDDVVNGILGALVSITAPCAFVRTYDALIIGAIGCVVALVSNDVIKNKLKLDDPVGAVGVHGAAGIWGVLSVGLFADELLAGVDVDSGLFRGGGFRLLGVQLLEVVAIIGWSIVCVAPFFYLIGILISRDWKNPRQGLRLKIEEELCGADQYLHKIKFDQSRANAFSRATRHLDVSGVSVHSRPVSIPEEMESETHDTSTVHTAEPVDNSESNVSSKTAEPVDVSSESGEVSSLDDIEFDRREWFKNTKFEQTSAPARLNPLPILPPASWGHSSTMEA